MGRKVAESILRGLKQALAHAQGTADESQYVVHLYTEFEKKAVAKQPKPIVRTRKPRIEKA